jgi:hypothetical protein
MTAPDTPPTGNQRAALPARLLVTLYFTWAHVCLLAALGLIVWIPDWLTQFFYDPRTIAIVHLVTLGWISSSILGALYIVSPTALRTPLPATPGDYGACIFMIVGTAGMVAHLALSRYEGMTGSAVLVWLAMTHVGARLIRALRAAAVPRAVKLHIVLAFVNVLAAGAMGLLLGFDKIRPFISGNVLSNVYAHAHLAAIGWAGMMIMGAGYRLFPMVLPAEMPKGRRLYASALLLEVGLLGLVPGLMLQRRWVAPFGLLIAAAFCAFLLEVRRMRSHRRPPASHLPRPDYGTLQSQLALGYLILSIVMGGVLILAPESEMTFRLAPVYGFVGLVGFVSQMVVGMEARILPMFSSLHTLVTSGGLTLLQNEILNRRLQAVSFTFWTTGVPVVAGGLWLHSPDVVRLGAALLLLGHLLGSIAALRWLRGAFIGVGPGSVPPATAQPPPIRISSNP